MEELADPSDWGQTHAPYLSQLESTIRCHICKEFMTAPVLTSCGHTFCSLCIRSHLNDDVHCPACRSKTQSNTLRKNTVIEELTTLFRTHRKDLIQSLSSVCQNESHPDGLKYDAGREKQENETIRTERADDSDNNVRRSSRKRNIANYAGLDVDKAEDGQIGECPICGQRMKIAEIETTHIVHCLNGQEKKRQKTSFLGASAAKPKDDTNQRLSIIAYNLYSPSNLQGLMKKLGIPHQGSKQVLQERHKKWVNLWNANLDSENPKPKSELLSALTKWEKSLAQSRQETFDVKKVDRMTYIREHNSEFNDLIAQAKKSRKLAKKDDSKDDRKGDNTDDIKEESVKERESSVGLIDMGKSSLLDGSMGVDDSITNNDTTVGS
uniref:Postreplication repair E3 ubiquitin-protein ligase RAD18 n=1 Tax=Blastobotrys adeninivorans TaxID=409370 RepID=A0A060T995_BLAAD